MSALKRNSLKLDLWLRNYNHLVTPLLTLLSLLAIVVGGAFYFADRDATLKKHSTEIHYLQMDVWELYTRNGEYPPSTKEQFSKMVTRGAAGPTKLKNEK